MAADASPPFEPGEPALHGQSIIQPQPSSTIPPDAADALRKLGDPRPNAAFGISMAMVLL